MIPAASSNQVSVKMNGLELTFDILATTPNEASLSLLAPALTSADLSVRGLAVDALCNRDSVEANFRLIQNWENLVPDQRQRIKNVGPRFCDALHIAFADNDKALSLIAIRIIEALQIHSMFPTLVGLVETEPDGPSRNLATLVVMRMASTQGKAARSDHDRPAVRGPMIRSLAEATRRYPSHKQQTLVDAFLVASKWTDSEFSSQFAKNSHQRQLLLDRFQNSDERGICELLCSALQRSRANIDVLDLIRSRSGENFRESLLSAISPHPGPNCIRNLVAIGIPSCCQLTPLQTQRQSFRTRCILAIMQGIAGTDHVAALERILALLPPASESLKSGLLAALHRFPPLDPDRLLQAAIQWRPPGEAAVPVSDFRRGSSLEQDVAVLTRILTIIQNRDPQLAEMLRPLLKPLHATELLPQLGRYRPSVRRRLGKVMSIVDLDFVHVIEGQMRHPVMLKRLEAIGGVVALGLADEFSRSLVHIAHNDHVEAQIRAARALGTASNIESLDALLELTMRPDSSIRDAAVLALRKRTNPDLNLQTGDSID
ncbi:hypothetical protein FF011L_31120 [Roseimaritima multifibrata]|uniref:HEAT repeat protein n=2 Tax=Roseimaritima multifibrata TaxID=1930274 RepID=A0A517MHH4_9BACT|nr:hypothetical protein FF011L_31120 [Roseimaritima multifibrata]